MHRFSLLERVFACFGHRVEHFTSSGEIRVNRCINSVAVPDQLPSVCTSFITAEAMGSASMASSMADSLFCSYWAKNSPGAQGSASSAATTQWTKSAIRGQASILVVCKFFSAQDTASYKAPSTRGLTASHSACRINSGRRSPAGIGTVLMKIVRSHRSGRCTNPVIPLVMIGLWKLKTASPPSVYKARVTKPPPLTSLQITSEIGSVIVEALSWDCSQLFVAAIATSRSELGKLVKEGHLGSIRSAPNRQAMLFPVPCSP